MKRIYDDTQLQKCYEAGYDASINGGNISNSHFSLFTSPDRTKAWERGNKLGKVHKRKELRGKE